MADEAARCTLDPTCEHGPHEASAHPCGRKPEAPGTPCRYCGDTVPLNGDPCQKCWRPIDVPTFRALFASLGYDTTVTRTTHDRGADE